MTSNLEPRRRQLEITPGDVFQLGLPWVLQNQSLFNFWNVQTGDYFVELEGAHYGWDSSTVQVTEAGPGFGPPLHQHPTEEIFVLAEGEVAFVSGDDIHYMKAPAIVRVPPNTTHNVTTLGTGRNKLVTFFSSNTPGASPVELHDPFAHLKNQSSIERDTMIANFRKVLHDFDDDGDGKLSYAEAPELIKAQFERYDTDHDGFITVEDAQGWD